MIVVGIGTTSRVTVAEAAAIINAALTKAAAGENGDCTVAALDRPAINPIIEDAAKKVGLGITFLSLKDLRAVSALCVTHSEKSMKHYGVSSIAEAAALAGVGEGGRLLVRRFCGRNTTASVAISR